MSERLDERPTVSRRDESARALFDHAPDGVLVTDGEGRCVDANLAVCRLFGRARDELVGRSVAELVRPEEAARVRAAIVRPSEAGEWTLRRSDGTELVADVRAATLPDGRWQAVLRDATERRRTEDALRRSEESLVRAQRAAHVGSFEWDLRTGAVSRSAEMCALYGYGPDAAELPPWSLESTIHPDDRALVRRVYEDALARGASYRVEHRVVRPDGTELVVLHQGDVVKEGDKVVRVVGTLLDITERKLAERERENALGYLRAVLDQCPVGILIGYADGSHRVEVNARAAEWLGRQVERVSDYPGMIRAVDGTELPTSERPLVRALRGERVESAEYQLLRADGTPRPIMASAAPVVDADGERLGAVAVFQDVTAVKELERLRAEWSSIVAHDLRQPLNAIALNARLAARSFSSDADGNLRHALETIDRAAKRLNRMIEDLLDLSRLDAHRMTLARRPTDLREIVAATVGAIAPTAPDRLFEVRVDDDVPILDVDPDRIAQVLENLLSNAVKYGHEATPIGVTVARREGLVVVEVVDEGPGILAEDVPRLFERFARVDAGSGKRFVKGTGLGLHIVRALVRAHGGDAELESGAGRTTFRFTLPV